MDQSQTAVIRTDPADFKVVQIAANLLAEDVERVTGKKPVLNSTGPDVTAPTVLVGTLGHSAPIDALVAAKKLDVAQLKDQWESFLITTVDGQLVIAGSDRRGTAFGVFELSQAMGVSPWYWWSDVAPAHQDNLYVAAGTRRFGPPSVQYRGIFINDEDWSLMPWAAKTFEPEVGNIGPKTYTKIFELLLRLKANTLWPVMHEVSTPFNAIPANALAADDWGIVMGSSHCEPMLRNNVGEWPKDNPTAFNFITNPEGVTKYWEERMQTNGKFENLYTLGIRGIHDDPMMGARGAAEVVPALEKIFGVQRDLIKKYVNPDPTKVAQIFCPYKEVLAYFLSNLQVPPDVTVVFPDDNFGYIRYLPTPAQIAARPGGFGVYYHISYLGNPASYVWLETTPPALIWEEMSKAYDHGIQKFWILNVGDLKPGEIGIDFFLQMAWDIKKWTRESQVNFLTDWATRQFGAQHAQEIAAILGEYYRLGYQRKPEQLQWNVGREAPRLSDLSLDELRARGNAYQQLAAHAEQLLTQLAPAQRDAFYELVDYPVTGAALANERFVASEMSRKPGAPAADWSPAFDEATAKLTTATARYNAIGGGKWQNLMYVDPLLPARSYRTALLAAPATTPPPPNDAIPITAIKSFPASSPAGSFAEKDGVISILAEHFAHKVDKPGAAWQIIPGLGRTGDAVGVFPTTAPSVELANVATDAPALEYPLYVVHPGNVTIHYNLIPTQPIVYGQGLRFAVALDDQPAQLVTITAGTGDQVGYDAARTAWSHIVLDNSTTATTTATLATPGPHTLKIYGVDPGVLLEKIVIDAGGLKPSYLGPPETLVSAGPR